MGVVINKLRQSAKGQECTLRIYAVCNHNPETTVLAHLPSNSGMATKSDDFFAVFACSACHEELDQRRLAGAESGYCLRALQRTQRIWYETGEMQFNEPRQIAKPPHKIVPRRPLVYIPREGD